MKIVSINASKSYNVLIGEGILNDLPKFIKELNLKGKILILTDKNVDALYGSGVKNMLENALFTCEKYVVSGGEKSKSAKDYVNLLEYLAEHKFTRSDIILALGGGVVGDLAGFVSATYLRGVKFIQVPTTLLAQVDSSVGGKTAINLKAGKNLAGAFYQPSLVVCDTLLLNTLPSVEYSSGMAEVIKYGFIFSDKLIELISQGMDKHAEEIITECITLKKNVVERDEFDKGDRQLLNFGHTLGHAIEKQSKYKIHHGIAVAMGMQLITQVSVKRGVCEQAVLQKLNGLLQQYRLDGLSPISIERLLETTLIDKKRNGNSITAVIPTKVGECILKKLTISEWKEFILS